MYNFTPDSFCTQPFSNLEVNTWGDYRVCCLCPILMTEADGKTLLNAQTTRFKEAFNSNLIREHRLALSRGEKPEKCKGCYLKDAIPGGGFSVRKAKNDMAARLGFVTMEQAKGLMNPDGSVDYMPMTLDLRFNNICNSKCLSCDPHHSNLWTDDWVKLHNVTEFSHNQRTYKLVEDKGRFKSTHPSWWESEEWWDDLKANAKNLKQIYLTGGEPMLMREHRRLLVTLIELDVAKNIELEYDTNLSVINPNLLKLFKKFRSILLRVSLDDVDDRYRIVRFPGNINTLVENIQIFKDAGINVTGFTNSVYIPTMYSMFRVIPFAKQLDIPVWIRFVVNDALDLKFLPKSAKEEIIHTYKTKGKDLGYQTETIIGYLTEFLDFENPAMIKEFVRIMEKLDQLRSTDWKTTMPDVVSLLKRHCAHAFNT